MITVAGTQRGRGDPGSDRPEKKEDFKESEYNEKDRKPSLRFAATSLD